MVLTLLVITLISGGSLGLMYNVTKAPIAASKLKKQQDAIRQVTPAFDNDPAAEVFELTSAENYALRFFPARQNGQLVGMAVETMTNKGFGGLIKVMVGFSPEGRIVNYQVLEHKETPGLGTKMDDWFKTDKGNQNILGKNPGVNKLTVAKDGGEVDAITAATISSRAFLDAIQAAYVTFKTHQQAQSATADSTATPIATEGGQP